MQKVLVFHVQDYRAGHLQKTILIQVLNGIYQTFFCRYCIPNIFSVLVLLARTNQTKHFFWLGKTNDVSYTVIHVNIIFLQQVSVKF